MANEFDQGLLVSIQVAELGMITPNIRAITCDWNEKQIVIRTIYDGAPSAADLERAEEVVTEMVSYYDDHNVKSEAVVSGPQQLLRENLLKATIYRRYEP